MNDAAMMIPVPFRADTIWAADRGGEVLVAMKPIAENLGLQWEVQYRRLRRTPVLAKGMSMMEIPSPGGVQEMACLPLKLLPGWLFSVDAARVKPEIRAKIEAYQTECYEVLWRYFRGEVASPRPLARPSSADVHNGIEASLHPHQLRVLAAIKAYGHISLAQAFARTGLSHDSNSRALYLLWYLGVVEAYEEGGAMKLRVIPAASRPGLPMPNVKKAR